MPFFSDILPLARSCSKILLVKKSPLSLRAESTTAVLFGCDFFVVPDSGRRNTCQDCQKHWSRKQDEKMNTA